MQGRERPLMTAEDIRRTDGAEPTWPGRIRRARAAAGTAALTVGAAMVVAVADGVRAVGVGHPHGTIVRAALVGTVAVAVGGWYGKRVAARAARALAEAATAAAAGRLPVAGVGGGAARRAGLGPVAEVVQGLLRDLRAQRQAVAVLERETQDRVANRTDALERQLGSLRWQASRDPLTGLLNRRALDAELSRHVDRYRQGGTDLCLLAIDVDRFKGLNDTLGHPAGDQFLRDVGQIIRSTVDDDGEAAAAFRVGGDEFVVLLGDRGVGTGLVVGERLASLVAALSATLRLPRPPGLSVGVCAASELGPTATADKLLAVADGRLYAAKASRGTARRAA